MVKMDFVSINSDKAEIKHELNRMQREAELALNPGICRADFPTLRKQLLFKFFHIFIGVKEIGLMFNGADSDHIFW